MQNVPNKRSAAFLIAQVVTLCSSHAALAAVLTMPKAPRTDENVARLKQVLAFLNAVYTPLLNEADTPLLNAVAIKYIAQCVNKEIPGVQWRLSDYIEGLKEIIGDTHDGWPEELGQMLHDMVKKEPKTCKGGKGDSNSDKAGNWSAASEKGGCKDGKGGKDGKGHGKGGKGTRRRW